MRVALVSFRLGGLDGVAIEAQKWASALGALGHDVVRVAGEGPVERILPGLALAAPEPPTRRELADALYDVDLVVVENVLSLPLNLGARDVLAAVLRGRPALVHHHDLASQRPHLAHLPGPPDDPAWTHVAISRLTRAALVARGIPATHLPNHFDLDPAPGDRATTRARLGVAGPLVLLASRAIPRKNVRGALRVAARLGATLWLLGPPEDGYDASLARLLGAHPGPVVRGPAPSVADAYAAADLVVVPSVWEGFGNPVVEAIAHRRPLAAYPYPVLDELTALGLDLPTLEGDLAVEMDPGAESRREARVVLLSPHLDLADLPGRLERILSAPREARH